MTVTRATKIGIGVLAALSLLVSFSGQALSEQNGHVKGKVKLVDDGKARSKAGGIVVTIEGVTSDKAAPADKAPMVRQKNKQFDPFLTVVPKGSTVDFPNDDKIRHNVFSVSKAKRFDLGLYKSGVGVPHERVAEIAVGFVLAFVAALLVVKPFVAFIGRSGFTSFAIYRVVLGAAVVGAATLGWL